MLKNITNVCHKDVESLKQVKSTSDNNSQTANKQVRCISGWSYTQNLYSLYNLLPIKDISEWRKFIVDMAAHSVTTQEDAQSPVFKKSNGTSISLADAIEPGGGVSVTVGSKVLNVPGISLSDLQRQMRESVMEHKDYYSQNEHSHKINAVVALNDLADGLNNKDKAKKLSSTRAEAYKQHCTNLYKALIPIIKNAQTGTINITLFDYIPVTITEKEQSIAVAMDGHQIILKNFTGATLFEQLYKPIYPDATALLLHHAYGELGWHGALSNKNHPSLKELQHDYKSQPYRAVTDTPPVYLNGQVPLSTESEEMTLCRHLSTLFAIDVLGDESGKGKPVWSNYSSQQALAKHLTKDMEACYCTLRANAKRYDLINNDRFGSHLAACFKDMQRPEKNEKLRVLLIESTTHVMAVKLRIKGTIDKPIYKVHFYDPNISNDVVRSKTSDLSTLESHTLKHYVDGINTVDGAHHYQFYYEETAPISMVMECDLTSLTKQPDPSLTTENKLTSFALDKLTETHLFFLLDHNLTHDFIELQSRLKKIGQESPEDLFTLLVARTGEGYPGLLFAMQRGHAAVIRAYGELFPLLPNDFQFLILSELTEDGRTGLFLALQSGKADAITAFGALLSLLSLEQQVELLFAKDADDSPGFCVAMQNGHAASITAFGNLIRALPIDQQLELLASIAADGRPGLFLALQNGRAEAITAFGELLTLLPFDKQLELLIAKNEDGIPAIFVAAQNKHWNAMAAYGKLLQQFLPSSIQEDGGLTELLANKDAEGISKLLLGLESKV
jgi:hypothetical protein